MYIVYVYITSLKLRMDDYFGSTSKKQLGVK